MPPAPSGATISYGPSFVPVARLIVRLQVKSKEAASRTRDSFPAGHLLLEQFKPVEDNTQFVGLAVVGDGLRTNHSISAGGEVGALAAVAVGQDQHRLPELSVR